MPIKNILVVDDSPTDRQYLSDILTKNGFKVATAENAEDALVKVKQAPPRPRPHGRGDAGPERLPGDAHAGEGRSDQEHPGDHLHQQGPGDRQDLGHAARAPATTSSSRW